MNKNRFFLDANVILDCLLARGNYKSWQEILLGADVCYVNNVVISTCSYITTKGGLNINSLFDFLESVVIIETDLRDYELAIELFNLHLDFEDCLIIANCINKKIEFIASGDQKLIKNLGSKIKFI